MKTSNTGSAGDNLKDHYFTWQKETLKTNPILIL